MGAEKREVYTVRRRGAAVPEGKEKKTKDAKPSADQKKKGKKPAAPQKAPDKGRRPAAKKAAPAKKTAGRTRERTADERQAQREREQRARERAAKKRRTQKEKEKKNAVMRDRRRAVAGGGGLGVTLCALLTAGMEALGFLVLILQAQTPFDRQALLLMTAAVIAGLAATLLLPRLLRIDALTMALTNFLCGVGLVMLYTVSPSRGVRQTIFYLMGLAGMAAISAIVSRMRRARGITLLAMLLGIGALLLPLLFGSWQNGAKNWVEIPFFGSFQPSELVKLALILSMAYYFSTHRTVLQMMPAILFAGACLVLLMLQRDLGTALIYYLTTLVMFYAACGNVPLTAVGLAGGAGAAMLGYQMFAHVKVRVAMWRNPWSDPLDKGYQIIQALLAIGSGGLFGVGLGQGEPDKIPMYYNDFIFAVVCEQLGMIFGLLVLAVYALLIVRCVCVALRSRRSFDLLLGCGVAALLGIQTFMIIGGVIKMIPLTGVTMPFMSYGGSSLVSCLLMIGVVHGINARTQTELEDDLFALEE